MKYYHISSSRWLPEEVVEVRSPDPEERGYGEIDIPRLSVSPTVCQCLCATPGQVERFYVYEVHVTDPIPPIEDEQRRVVDKDISGEMWLVQSHIDEAQGNKITLTYLGTVQRPLDLRTCLKIYFAGKRLRLTSEEEECLWDKSGGVWKPLFGDSKDMQRLIEGFRQGIAPKPGG